jgi:hypothetical protein
VTYIRLEPVGAGFETGLMHEGVSGMRERDKASEREGEYNNTRQKSVGEDRSCLL